MPLQILKSRAIATLTLKLLTNYNLNPLETKVIFDEMDGETNSKIIKNQTIKILEKYGLNIEIQHKKKADSRVIGVRKADRIGYFLTGIRIIGRKNKWPFRKHKIDLNNLENLAVEFLENKFYKQHPSFAFDY